MPFNKVVTILTILFFSIISNAQDYDFGKVSKMELLENTYPEDSSAVAAYLYKFRKTYYLYSPNSGFSLVTEIHERVKVYNKDGFSFATKTINLAKHSSNLESVSKIKAFTYSIEDGEILETKLEKDGIFKSEYSKNLNQVKITLPNVKEGSVLEYKYKITSPFIQSIDEFRFQEGIPIKKLKASISIFDYFKFNQRQKGFLVLNPITKREMNSHLGTHDIITSYNLTNIPALKNESFVSNIDNYRAGVKFEIVSLEVPGEMSENFAKSWEDVVETIYKDPSFGNELAKTNYFEEDLNQYLEGVNGDEIRAQKVLSFVKNKVKWNNRLGVGTDEGVKKAYKINTGNAGDINLMLVACLKHAGLNAYPVILSTRDNGIQLFPTLQGFNHVIAGVKDGDSYITLDATEKYSSLNVLPMRDLNWFGRAIMKDGTSEMVDMLPSKKAVETTMLDLEISDDGTIEGSSKQRFTGHYAMLLREKYASETEVEYIDKLKQQYSGLEISNFEIGNKAETDKPFNQAYDVFAEEGIDESSGKLYFSPMLYLSVSESPFKSKKREFPIDFGYPWQDRFIISIKLPEGYKVDVLPENVILSLPEKLGKFTYSISEIGGFIKLSSSISFNNPLIKNDYYDGLKEFYRQIIEKQTEKVVLSRI